MSKFAEIYPIPHPPAISDHPVVRGNSGVGWGPTTYSSSLTVTGFKNKTTW